jgi:hypothetical protein
MNTKTKMVPAEALPAARRVVRGYFDPLTEAMAVALTAERREGQALVVWVDDPPSPVLEPEARARLVAALAVVDQVVREAVPVDADHREQHLECRRQLAAWVRARS